MPRRILHFRIVSFAVAVARARDASLRGRPVLVASGQGPRSVVLLASPEAWGDGVRRGMVLPEALRRCRGARILPPDPELYARASTAVTSVLQRYTPVVEPARGGCFFADMTGTHRLFGAAVDVAARIQREMGEGLRLPANAGVAANKLVSGVAARILDLPRNLRAGLCDVPPGDEESFLRPVKVGNLPVVQPEVEGRLLADLNVITTGQLAALPVPLLVTTFGRTGVVMHRQARGLDDSPVRPPVRAPGVEERTPALPEDTNDDTVLLAALHGLVERAGRRLRRMGTLAGEAALSARYSDGVAATRRVRFHPPLDGDISLFRRVRPLFEEVVSRRGRVRSMSLRLARLGAEPAQLPLFPGHHPGQEEGPARALENEASLMKALDRLRARHGERAIYAGRLSALRGAASSSRGAVPARSARGSASPAGRPSPEASRRVRPPMPPAGRRRG